MSRGYRYFVEAMDWFMAGWISLILLAALTGGIIASVWFVGGFVYFGLMDLWRDDRVRQGTQLLPEDQYITSDRFVKEDTNE